MRFGLLYEHQLPRPWGPDTEQARKASLALHPIGRLGMAEDIAKGIVFLASDDASFMTGAGLVVDGGWTAH